MMGFLFFTNCYISLHRIHVNVFAYAGQKCQYLCYCLRVGTPTNFVVGVKSGRCQLF